MYKSWLLQVHIKAICVDVYAIWESKIKQLDKGFNLGEKKTPQEKTLYNNREELPQEMSEEFIELGLLIFELDT